MDPKEFTERFENWRLQIEKEIDHRVPSADTEPTKLHSAMRHSLEAGGKRLRPVLVCAVAEAFSSKSNPLPAAAAIECLHTYTLIHDDLPAMDDSDLRRGRPTCHKAFGEAAAILAGDGLLTLTFQILGEGYPTDPALANNLVVDLATASGSLWLVGGQMDDIDNEGIPLDVPTLSSINRRKTGALIAAACIMGARIGGASAEQVETVRQFGVCLGEAFQVIDDILDFTATEEQTGKSSGRDEANGKVTLATLEGLDAARKRAEELTQQADHLLSQFSANTDFLSALVRWMADRSN
ncbi:polyprenyl synthetase family protein [Puniceicoccus vermicola]|uniref:Polyprenyl synthetase family protein n=1 Tax=Puniceicoccus vermicola TaxID=388746 RepID=A0A7X1AY98_9BACT|nr:farnesyl diphosphate synthase [Puniceicoccus vermicola]MBC2602117.1 polyprenyl synthetase family protein [Puniceicoccus vermicola]